MKYAFEEIKNTGKVFSEHTEEKREQRKQQLKDTIRNCCAFLLGILCSKLLRMLFGGD